MFAAIAKSLMVLGCLASPLFAGDEAADGVPVVGRVTSTQYESKGGGIRRAIVAAVDLATGQRVARVHEQGERFETCLPPGRYRLHFSAKGTRGATFEVVRKKINVPQGKARVDVGAVDLPASKTTELYGQPAPALKGLIAWKHTDPLMLEDLRGRVVVLDFFAHYCSICHHHKPDLVRLRDTYGESVVVLAIHNDTLKTMDAVTEKVAPVYRRVFDGHVPKFATALDGSGEESVFDSYGIHGVPAVILIDQQGKVVRRYHHAGKPELEADIEKLLESSP